MASEASFRSVVEFAERLGVAVSAADVHEDVESSPDAESLLGVVSALEAWGIATDALQMSVEHLPTVASPTLMSLRSGELGLVTAIRPGESVSVRISEGDVTIPWAELDGRWDGVVVVPDATKPIVKRTPRSDGSRFLPWVQRVAGGVVLLALVVGVSHAEPLVWLCAALSVAGLTLSIGLSREELGVGSFMSGLCRAGGSRFSCQSVLSSRAAKLGPVSMADVGLAYFAGQALVLTLFGASQVSLLWGLSAAALPYTVFSISYQAFVVRLWCPMCLGVQAVLVAQAVALSFTQPWLQVPSAVAPVVLGLVPFVAVGAGWVLAKPGVVASRQLPQARAARARLERNPVVIQALLAAAEAPTVPEVPLELVHEPTGDALIELVAYTDPACPHCSDLHAQLAAVLERFGSVCRVRWRYVDVLHAPSSSAFFERLATLVAGGRRSEAMQWAEAWFTAARARTKAPTSPEPTSPDGASLLARHNEAYATAPLGAVPLLLVGDRRWPDALRREALFSLIEGLRSDAAEEDAEPDDDAPADEATTRDE